MFVHMTILENVQVHAHNRILRKEKIHLPLKQSWYIFIFIGAFYTAAFSKHFIPLNICKMSI